MLWSLFKRSLYNGTQFFSWEIPENSREGRTKNLLKFRQWIFVKPVWARSVLWWPDYDLPFSQRTIFDYPGLGFLVWTFYHENRLWTSSGIPYGDNPDRDFESLSFLWNQAAFKALDILPEEAFVRTVDFLGFLL